MDVQVCGWPTFRLSDLYATYVQSILLFASCVGEMLKWEGAHVFARRRGDGGVARYKRSDEAITEVELSEVVVAKILRILLFRKIDF